MALIPLNTDPTLTAELPVVLAPAAAAPVTVLPPEPAVPEVHTTETTGVPLDVLKTTTVLFPNRSAVVIVELVITGGEVPVDNRTACFVNVGDAAEEDVVVLNTIDDANFVLVVDVVFATAFVIENEDVMTDSKDEASAPVGFALPIAPVGAGEPSCPGWKEAS